ncbi:MAG: D-tyrosyl-tRNA(Tyr) deacylase [Cenarchaeum sp. SB0665_bin_23]|nr:D-tyrosyl-tRNA(Tyr) deacylase [Cenarchaeum sp. SB0665_bin_23]MYG33167.1 D-tyrosyl-tRNA(Tyr) deacylase [Cenarchaeum sp. SB0677_bin_16]
MLLLVAYDQDPAGRNMVDYLIQKMTKSGPIYRGESFDLVVLDTPITHADWLESKFDYDGFVFLSRHAAKSGVPALTCHSTGNFDEAMLGGNERQVAIPFPSLQKRYLKELWGVHERFAGFDITLEATHHGPTALSKPSIFVEVGTTPAEWNNAKLCHDIAAIVERTIIQHDDTTQHTVAVGFGGTHYPHRFTREVIHGRYSFGSIIPKHALQYIDENLLYHIIRRNPKTNVALLDWDSMGTNRRRILDMLNETSLEVVRV